MLKSAEEIRQLTKTNKEKDVSVYLNSIATDIESAAKKGHCSIYASGVNSLSYTIKQEVFKKLREKGYTVEEFDDQREGSWVTISW